MTHNHPQWTKRTLPSGRSDIYTLLLIIAAVALALAISFVWYRNTTLFDTASPFQIKPLSQMDQGNTVRL